MNTKAHSLKYENLKTFAQRLHRKIDGKRIEKGENLFFSLQKLEVNKFVAWAKMFELMLSFYEKNNNRE